MENDQNKSISAFLEAKLKKILEEDESYDELKWQLKEKSAACMELLEKENELEFNQTLEKMSNLNLQMAKLDHENVQKESEKVNQHEQQILKMLRNVRIGMETVQENLGTLDEVILQKCRKEVQLLLEEYESTIRKVQTEPIKFSKKIRDSKSKIEEMKIKITAAEKEILKIKDETCELEKIQEFYRVQCGKNQEVINEKKRYLSGFKAVQDQHNSALENVDRLRKKLETNRATLKSQEEEKFKINYKNELISIEVGKAKEKRGLTEMEKSRLSESAAKLEADLEVIKNLQINDDLLDNSLIDFYCRDEKIQHFRNESNKQKNHALKLLTEMENQKKIQQDLKSETDEMRNSTIQEEFKLQTVESECKALTNFLFEKKQFLEEKERKSKEEIHAKLTEISKQQIQNKKLMNSITQIDAKAKMLTSQFQKNYLPLSKRNRKLEDALADLRKVRLSVSASKSKSTVESAQLNETQTDDLDKTTDIICQFGELCRSGERNPMDDSFANDNSFLNCTLSTVNDSEK